MLYAWFGCVCVAVAVMRAVWQLAFVLDNVFTPEECKLMIQETEALGYSPALINVGGGKQMYCSVLCCLAGDRPSSSAAVRLFPCGTPEKARVPQGNAD